MSSGFAGQDKTPARCERMILNMFIKQLSVFVENKKGRIAEITRLLAEHEVDIRALSIADTADYGILRLIVDDPEKASLVLKAADVTVSITNVVGIAVDDKPGAFAAAMEVLNDGDVDVEYAYAFITREPGKAYVILRPSDREKAVAVFKDAGVRIIGQEEIFK